MLTLILSGALGFLLASLIALFLAPPLWRRAVRVTTKKLQQQSPRMIDEGHADRDQMRAEFAVNTRKMEVRIDRLKEETDTQRIELSTAEKKRDRLQGKIESLQAALEKSQRKGEKLDAKVERLLNDIGKKNKQLTSQAERLKKQTEMLNDQAVTLEENALELSANKQKIADYVRKEFDFSTITSRQDLELSKLRSMQQEIKFSNRNEDTAHKRECERLNQLIRDGLTEIAGLTDNLEARKKATVRLRLEVGRNKDKISQLIHEIQTRDEKIRQLEDQLAQTGATGKLHLQLKSVPSKSQPAASGEDNRQDNDNKLYPATLPLSLPPAVRQTSSLVTSLNNSTRDARFTNGQEAPAATRRNGQDDTARPPHDDRPAEKTVPPGKTLQSPSLETHSLETPSLAERIRALQSDNSKSM